MDIKKLIFNIYKDGVLISKKFKLEIIEKFNVTPVMAGDIFAEIQNYQIKKYGERLTYDDVKLTSEERKHISSLAKNRMRMKKNNYYKNVN